MKRSGQDDPFEVLSSAELTANQLRLVLREGSNRLLGHQNDDRLPAAARYIVRLFEELDRMTLPQSQDVVYASNVPEVSRKEYPVDSPLVNLPINVGRLFSIARGDVGGTTNVSGISAMNDAQFDSAFGLVLAKKCMGEAYVDLMQRPKVQTDAPE